ncbi:MAG: HepT-like ribonuclease domain-containing protein [Nocardioidaceae bacterium]
MSRSDADLLDDIAAAIRSIYSHLEHGPISVEIVMDAVAMRLLEIGEAVKALSPEITATEPDIKWRDIAGMRDFLATTTSQPTPKASMLLSTTTSIRSARPLRA